MRNRFNKKLEGKLQKYIDERKERLEVKMKNKDAATTSSGNLTNLLLYMWLFSGWFYFHEFRESDLAKISASIHVYL